MHFRNSSEMKNLKLQKVRILTRSIQPRALSCLNWNWFTVCEPRRSVVKVKKENIPYNLWDFALTQATLECSWWCKVKDVGSQVTCVKIFVFRFRHIIYFHSDALRVACDLLSVSIR